MLTCKRQDRATVVILALAGNLDALTVVMLVTLLVTGSVGYDAPHPFAFKITAFVGLMPKSN